MDPTEETTTKDSGLGRSEQPEEDNEDEEEDEDTLTDEDSLDEDDGMEYDDYDLRPQDTSAFVSGFDPDVEKRVEQILQEDREDISHFIKHYLKLGNVRYDATSEVSRQFFEDVDITRSSKTKKVNGLKYKGLKIYYIRGNTDPRETLNQSNEQFAVKLQEFKQLVKTLSREYAKTDRGAVDEAAGVFIPPETAAKILQDTGEDVKQVKDDYFVELDQFFDSYTEQEDVQGVQETILGRITKDAERQKQDEDGSKEDLTRQIITALSQGEFSQDLLALDRKDLLNLANEKIKALVGTQTDPQDTSEKEQWRKLAHEERLKAQEIDEQAGTSRDQEDKRRKHVKNAQLYDKMAEMCDIRADEIRLQVGLKPESERVVKILNNNTNAHPETKFAKFKEWVRNNKLSFASSMFGILGGIAAISGFLYGILKDTAQGVKRVAQATYNTARQIARALKSLPGIVTGGVNFLGGLIYTVLSILAKILGFVSSTLWIIILLILLYLIKLLYDMLPELRSKHKSETKSENKSREKYNHYHRYHHEKE